MNNYLTVSQLNKYIKSVLENESFLSNFTIIGEVTSLTKHYTGHFYFTLKDEYSTIKCMMFASYASRIGFDLNNGQQVLIQGYIGVYDKNGTYQIYCRNILPYGEGQYLLELAKLKEKLKNEGLFDKEKKKIPYFPKKIGLITAKTGAAIHDFFSTLNRRLKVETYIFPCLVQGDDAPKSIIEQINIAEEFDLDVLIITRGGGSKEDLRCFNDEALVRRASELKIPLITAVGHQIDTTLIDYVSDLTCITPTDAATKVVKSKDEIVDEITFLNSKMLQAINHQFESYEKTIMHLDRALSLMSPKNRLSILSKEILSYNKRLDLSIKKQLDNDKQLLSLLKLRLKSAEFNYFKSIYSTCINLNEKLNYVNPYNLLENGYSLIRDKDNNVLSSIKNIVIDEIISLDLKDGRIQAKVTDIKEK